MAFSMAWNGGEDEGAAAAREALAGFRGELYRCLTRRADALFSLADAVLCAGGRVSDLARLSLVPEFGRGHGALYDGLNDGRLDVARLRAAVAGLPLPAWPDGGIRLAVDVSGWLRPEAAASPERMFCHVYGRGQNAGQLIPGWPYSLVAALGPGASSWAVMLDAVRIGPWDDATDLTAAQLREVVTRLIAAGRRKDGDPAIMIAMDAGYDPARLAWLLRDLPVTVCARVRSGRVFHAPAPPRPPGARGRPGVHGPAVRCAGRTGEDGAAVTADAVTASFGPARVTAWHRMHPKLVRGKTGWSGHPAGEDLPVVEGTLIRLAPRAAGREPMWLWAGVPQAGGDGRAPVAGLPAPVRHRARLPVPQAAAGLDPPAAARPRGRRPLDLACHRRLRPALARPAGRRRPAPALAAASAARADDACPGPRCIPRRPPDRGQPRKGAETFQARPRAAERLEEQDQGTPPDRRQTQPQAPETAKEGKTDNRLNDKPSEGREEVSPRTSRSSRSTEPPQKACGLHSRCRLA